MRNELNNRSCAGKCGVWVAAFVFLVLAAGVGGWVGINAYLESGALNGYLKAKLSETAGAPVEFERIGFVPFTRVSVEGLRVAGGERTGEPPGFACRAVRLGFAPGDLLRGRLRFERLTVEGPHLLVRDGKIPFGAKGGGAAAPKAAAKPAGAPGVAVEGAAPEWSIDRLEIAGGTVEGRDAKGARLWMVEGLDFTAQLGSAGSGGMRANGKIEAARVVVGKGLALTGVSSPLKFEGERIELPELRFATCGGSGGGSVAADTGGAEPKFQADVQLSGVDAGAAAESFGGDASRVSGKVALAFKGGGQGGDLNRLAGAGSFRVQPAKFSGSEMLRGLGTMLMVPELANSAFESIHGRFDVGRGQVVFSEIRTEPRERLQIVASGLVGMDGGLDLRGTASVKSATLNLAPLLSRAGGTQAADGFMEVPFTVKGTTSDPKVAIAPAAATGIVGGLLRNLFGKPAGATPDQQNPQAPAQQKEPPAEKPVDALKKLLPFGR